MKAIALKLIVIACWWLPGGAPAAQNNNPTGSRVLFAGSGTRPRWSVRMEPEQIRLVRGKDIVWVPATAPILAQDQPAQRYQIQTEAGEMILHITPGGCADTPKEGSQQVVVQYRRGKDKTFTEYKGCGRFYPDYRLQDIYVVQQIGPTVLDRQKKLPQLAFHLQDSKVLGTTGCNNLDASIKVDGPILHLGMLRTTRKACPDTYEPELLQALTPGAYYYHIAEGLLVLERKGKPMVQLKKID